MKKIFLSVFLLSLVFILHAQLSQVDRVQTKAKLKTLNTSANMVYVSDSNALYSLCPTCIANDIDIITGPSGKIWKKVSGGGGSNGGGSNFTTEDAQDAFGAMASSEFSYNDVANTLSINNIASNKITQDATHRFATDTEKTLWNTVSGKQNAITLTTTGSSGPATLVGNTLNIPEYLISGGEGGEPLWLAASPNIPRLDAAVNSFTGIQSGAGFQFYDSNWRWFRDDANETGNQYSLITRGAAAGSRRFLWTNSDNTIKFGGYIGDLGASTGVEDAFSILPRISQSGTAGYNGLMVNVIGVASEGSGSKNILNLKYASTSKFIVGVDGSVTIVDGNQAAGKVFTSDDNGKGSWQTPSGGGGGGYTLPIATSSTLGGIKVGARLTINPTTGVLDADIQGGGGGGGGSSFTTPVVVTVSGSKFLRIPTTEGRGEFSFTWDGSYINGNGHVDNVMQWGWNHNGAGGRTNPLDAELHMAIESEYQTFPGADPDFEFHIEGQALNGLTNRYMTFNASKTNGHGNGTWRMDSWQFYPNNNIGVANDTPYFNIGVGGQTTIRGNSAKLDIINGANIISMQSNGPDMSWTNYGGGQAGFYSGSFVITAQTNSAAGYIYLRPGGGDTYIEKNINDRNKLILTNSNSGSSAHVSEEFQTNVGVTGKIIANNSNTTFTDLLAANTFSLIGFQSAGVNIYSANNASKIRLAVGENQTLTDVVVEVSKDSLILKKPLRFSDGTTLNTAAPTFGVEEAQDAFATMASSEFTYVDATPSLSINTIAQSKITGLSTTLSSKADLVGGIVPTSQLPSSVVGIVQVANFASLPGTGASNTIYITLDNNKRYIYSTSYIELGATPPVTSVNGLIADVVLTAASVGAVPTSRTLTINGTTLDLTSNKSWTVGDLSSNTSTSVDNEVMLFSGTSGKTSKRATITGIANLTAGVLTTAVAADFPTLNQSTTGNSENVNGTVAINHGGTGQTTNTAAFNALSPVTTLGDIIIGSGTNTNTRLAGNITTTKKFLVQTGDGSISAAPLWGLIVAGDVPTLNQNTSGSAGSLSAILNTAAFPALTGEVSNTAGSLTTTVSNAAVIGKVLTGYTSGSGTISATDNILQAIQKLNGNNGLKVNISDTSSMVSNYVRSNNSGTSVDNELVVYDKTGGRTVKRAIGTGYVSLTSGVYSVSTTIPASVVGLGSVENTALSTWPGTANIVTVGTITTGTWSATAVGPTKGGTGFTTYTLGDIIYSDASNSLVKLAGNTTTTRKFLRQVGNATISAAPAWDVLAGGDIPNITESQVTNLTTDLAAKINVSDSSGMLTNYVRSNNGGTSVDGEVVIYDKTGGRTIKRASGTGPAKLTSGVLSASNINLASEVTGDLPFANIVQVATATILGRTTAATGDIEVLTVLPTAVFPALTGEVTNSAGSLSTTVGNAAVIGKVLTGYTSGSGTVAATDNILQAIQKLNGNDALRESTANKDATGGYAGLTLFKINFKNVANTFTSFFTNTNTAARTYTFQDRDGTIADNTDLGLKANLAGPTFTGTVTLPTGTVAVTQTAANSSTAIATTAFVEGALMRKTYFDVSEASASHTATKVAGTYAMSDGDVSSVSGTGTLYPQKIIHITGTDYPTVDGVTPKLNLKVILEVNDVAPTGNYTFGLYPVTRPATSGGAGLNIYTLGTVVTGSTVLFTTPAADGQLTGTSGDFALPADGFYVVGFVSTATVATSSHLHMITYLRMRNN